MTSLLAFFLIMGGCGGVGLLAFFRLENRVRILSSFVLLADRLVSEIEFRLTSLPELSERIPSLKFFWDEMDYALCGEETFEEAWCRASNALELSEFDKSLICSMGEILGQYDTEGQARTLNSIQKQLEISLEKAREQRKNYGRLYGVLGFVCGFLLFVVFF